MMCPDGILIGGMCASMEWLAQSWIDTAFYTALMVVVPLWIAVRLVRGRRRAPEQEGS